MLQDCIRVGVFPSAWKSGEVVWILKEGKDPNLEKSYRPITLLSTLGKCFEKIIANRTVQHLNEEDCLSKRQYGFRKDLGTENAIKQLLEDISEYRKTNNFVMVISLDVEAAFDTINWNHLMKEINRYKIPTYLRQLLYSYLIGRKVVSGTSELGMNKGCPQGSVLGPVIWNIAYNFVLKELESENITPVCYADDTAITIAGPNLQYLKKKAKRVLLRIDEMLARAGLGLNIEKNNLLLINGEKFEKVPPFKMTVYIYGKKMNTRPDIKYLGIIIDNKLEWRKHIEETIIKCEKTLPGIATLCHNVFGYTGCSFKIGHFK